MRHHPPEDPKHNLPPPPPEAPDHLNTYPVDRPLDTSEQDRTVRKRRSNPLLLPLVLVSVVAVVFAFLYVQMFFSLGKPNTTFVNALETCEIEDSLYIYVADEGESLLMTSEGDESPGASISEIACVLFELEVPASIINRFETTRALDGTQTGTWDHYDATWNYHPNSGSNITITLAKSR